MTTNRPTNYRISLVRNTFSTLLRGRSAGQASQTEVPGQLRRWLVFNLVGGFGVVVQLFTLVALTEWAGLHYVLATGLAVEIAVLHNFVWHERWTWRDRARHDKPGWWKRLLRFQFANGVLSIGGNLVMVPLLAVTCGMNYLLADVFSITVCAVLNFLAGDRLVFPQTRRA
ncbi:MAG: GtrA family protein [Terriglobia bacterium]